MRTNVMISDAKVFNVKNFGTGCRFAIKVNSKKQDGSYTNGTWLNCKAREVLKDKEVYTLEGFLSDNEYNDKNSLEFIVMTAIAGSHQRNEYAKVEVEDYDASELQF
jgi:hypothetical protein